MGKSLFEKLLCIIDHVEREEVCPLLDCKKEFCCPGTKKKKTQKKLCDCQKDHQTFTSS